ncbi:MULTISPECIES: hypothetical protein [Serratia]|uniref:Uncharacterized protein n=1 Tax=Serratia bockelmannii TaxID=2703793 RepID=A0ABT8LPQ5_9GAMM|nr:MULTISPECIES: hypothetical protein [Serratia]MDN6879195.1 hypothetical protein [Serratia bockelmannii]NMT25732.1 hypothetical protein [Serratia marcescens]
MSNNSETDFTPADEKALAGYAAWTALVRALQIQGSLDLSVLSNQLMSASQRYQSLGETGAANYLRAYFDDVQRMAEIAPPNHAKG